MAEKTIAAKSAKPRIKEKDTNPRSQRFADFIAILPPVIGVGFPPQLAGIPRPNRRLRRNSPTLCILAPLLCAVEAVATGGGGAGNSFATERRTAHPGKICRNALAFPVGCRSLRIGLV